MWDGNLIFSLFGQQVLVITGVFHDLVPNQLRFMHFEWFIVLRTSGLYDPEFFVRNSYVPISHRYLTDHFSVAWCGPTGLCHTTGYYLMFRLVVPYFQMLSIGSHFSIRNMVEPWLPGVESGALFLLGTVGRKLVDIFYSSLSKGNFNLASFVW